MPQGQSACTRMHLRASNFNFFLGEHAPDPLVETMIRYALHGRNWFTIAPPH